MSKNQEWDKERVERFARPATRMAVSPHAELARRVTADWAQNSNRYTFLDVGTGPGRLLVEVKTVSPKTRVIGADPSEHMLEIARRNAEAAGFPDIETILGSAENIPVESETVDLVVAQWSLHDWDDPEKGFSEIYRVLKPGGKVVVVDWNSSYPKWKFYLHNLSLMRRAGWYVAKEGRNSFRKAYPFAEVIRLVREGNLEPAETEGKELRFFIKAVKTGRLE